MHVAVLYGKLRPTSPDTHAMHGVDRSSDSAGIKDKPIHGRAKQQEEADTDIKCTKQQPQKWAGRDVYIPRRETLSFFLPPPQLRRRFDTFSHTPPTLSSFSTGFSNITWKDACDRYRELLNHSVEEVVQGRNSFKNVDTYEHHGVLLPKLTNSDHEEGMWIPGALPQRTPELMEFYKQEMQLAEYDVRVYNTLRRNIGTAEFCDPADADYTPTKDAACLAYLGNPANWMSLKPMSSVLKAGRTIKLLLSLRHYNMTAVVKLSQKPFLMEPVSEVVAFHVDRVLGFRRVPPTAWVQIPVDFIKAAAATLGPFYVRWMEEAVLATQKGRAITSTCDDQRFAAAMNVTMPKCILASVQLWMWDVDLITRSTFAGYVTHLSPPPTRDTASSKKDSSNSNSAEASVKKEEWKDNTDTVGSMDEYARETHMSTAAMRDLAAREEWDQLAFDAIIGNTDRWIGHNTFALASCEPGLSCQTERLGKRKYEPRSKSTRRFIYIDQGSSFYHSGFYNLSVFSETHGESYCRVHQRTVERLERITLFAYSPAYLNTTISAATPVIARTTTGNASIEEANRVESSIYTYILLPRLPAKVELIVPHVLIKRACRRVWYILAHRTRCLRSNKTDIFF